jgi:hypothetical protein
MNRLGQLKSVEEWERAEGSPSPLGATWVDPASWNFALFSRHATGHALLYGSDVVKPVFELKLGPVQQERPHAQPRHGSAHVPGSQRGAVGVAEGTQTMQHPIGNDR